MKVTGDIFRCFGEHANLVNTKLLLCWHVITKINKYAPKIRYWSAFVSAFYILYHGIYLSSLLLYEEYCMEDGFRWGDLRERNHLEDLSLDMRMMLKWIFKNCDGEAWTGVIFLRMGEGGELLWTHNEPSASVQYGEFLDHREPPSYTEQYVIHFAFLQQQCFSERASTLRYTYIACLVTIYLLENLCYYVFISSKS